ncbi:MAG: HK97 gp10 family phage protein [Microthrixaceae bacterium]|nr:HK97 gp10 family phage protein [Microthrixaceae bacterium]
MPEVQIDGFKDLRTALRKIDPALVKDFRKTILPIAQDLANVARSRVPVRTGRAAASVRAGVSGNTAYLQGGKGLVPYFGWLDFGSRDPVSGAARKVGPWTKSGAGPRDGRFIYPAIIEKKHEIEERVAAAMAETIEKVLPHDI